MNDLDSHTGDLAAARLTASVAGFALGVSQEEIMAGDRGSGAVPLGRQVAMYLCHVAFELSLARTARAFGRDRSTVSHACNAVEDRREDPRFELWISGLETMLHEAPAPGWRQLVAEANP